MANAILSMIEFGFSLWNKVVELVLNIVSQSPMQFGGGKAWSSISGFLPLFQAIGVSLIVICFLISLFSQSISIKDDLRIENILRLFIRLSFSEFLVVHSVDIMSAIFSWVGNIMLYLGNTPSFTLQLTEEQRSIIEKVGFLDGLVVFILGVIIFFITIACSAFMIYTVYFRFMHIFLLVPYFSLAMSTFAGTGTISSVMVSYIKNFLAVAFEGVTIILAIIISNAFIEAGIDVKEIFGVNMPDFLKVLMNLLVMMFSVGITVGSVKGARELTGRILGI